MVEVRHPVLYLDYIVPSGSIKRYNVGILNNKDSLGQIFSSFLAPKNTSEKNIVYLEMNNPMISLEFFAWHPEAFAKQQSRLVRVLSSAFGILYFSSFITFFMAVIVRGYLHWFSFLFSLTFSTYLIYHTGFANSFLGPIGKHINQEFNTLLCSTVGFGSLLSTCFLNDRNILNNFVKKYSVCLSLFSFLLIFQPNSWVGSSLQILVPAFLLGAVLWIVSGILSGFKGEKEAVYFALTWIIFSALAGISAGKNVLLIDIGGYPQFLMLPAALANIVGTLLTVILVQREYQIRQEKQSKINLSLKSVSESVINRKTDIKDFVEQILGKIRNEIVQDIAVI